MRSEGVKLRIGKPLVIAFVSVFFTISACGGGSTADWADLPEYLSGGVVIYGDSRTGDSMHRLMMEGMASLTPEAVFHTGDLVNDGRVADNWVTFNNIASQLPSGTPFYPALGNHEHESSLYFDNFELPGNERWYSVNDIEGLKFIVLDTGSSLAAATSLIEASTQYHWLESELSSSISSTDFTIVTFHYPLYSTGQHGSDEPGIRDDLVPLFQQYGVDTVFNGHDHDYERSTVNGIRYIVAGGGGAPLRDQKSISSDSDLFVKAYHFCVLYFDGEGKLMVDVWNDSVEIIDSFEITNR
ncbi:MAG: metallophosphoesterase [bacterium]|nr:metallophosphoesterase [bacterium]MDT8366683.1 metallophosphoesterase [bacterium]